MKSIRHGSLKAGMPDHPGPPVSNPVKVQDVTLRDGHQSLFATRCRTGDIIPVADEMDDAGFYSLEVWGGATFDTMHRYLAEDPWERIREFKKHMRKTPLSMLLRGQNLVGYRNYPDDVAEAFVERACENGIDIFRVFDALNDFRNFETVVRIIKRCERHFQGSICFSLTGPRMGGEVYNLDYYLRKARELEDMGADTICIKDMAGLMAPYDAYVLVKSLKEAIRLPIHLHCHFTSGMADMSLLKAIEAGADIVDTCLSPWAFRTSHPAVEPLVAALAHTDRDTGLDLNHLAALSVHFEKISPNYRQLLDERMSIIDINVLLHQIPGGMLSNLISQLREMDAADRLEDVFRQLPIVRRELGQVPLVTPTSQIVGIQAVNNVLFDTEGDRYTMITSQTKDLCYGLYGKTPASIDEGVRSKALKDYSRGGTPIDVRPADVLEPELEKAAKEVSGLARDIEDIITCALYPTTGKRFLRWKYGLEEIPDHARDKGKEPVRAEVSVHEKPPADREMGSGAPETQTFNVYVNDDFFRIRIEQVSGGQAFGGALHTLKEHAVKAANPAPKAPPEPAKPSGLSAALPPSAGKLSYEPDPAPSDGTSIVAPMPGMVIRLEAKEGAFVDEGDVVLILEAMKMENFIVSPVRGIVKEFLCKESQSVRKNDVLAVIA